MLRKLLVLIIIVIIVGASLIILRFSTHEYRERKREREEAEIFAKIDSAVKQLTPATMIKKCGSPLRDYTRGDVRELSYRPFNTVFHLVFSGDRGRPSDTWNFQRITTDDGTNTTDSVLILQAFRCIWPEAPIE